MARVGFGIIGCGNIGPIHAEAISQVRGARLVAVADLADIAIKAPGDSTKAIQEAHLVLYHTFCALIEAHYFPEMR